ncbi:MAG TPA: aminoacyl-tRNA hydrolase [Methyloprofundus sp.]|uniref:alternative ribosome rescue aminoacyl-tRNA hydrolase ArfB n=1 Tax=Methyloprofundus sp. TaxID=2020875 RepID=UPI001793F16B|nr:alternative ribosome rescue aminoacyl-tRNA hydrolase ArfB [Methyloprofundus sp.]HIG64913.1 aminoacyl-tRNA hydrolase [Methyloprofundus sp.]
MVKTHQFSDIIIPDNEIEISAIRSQGSGGQNVNKVSSAIHLRFDIKASTLPEFFKQRLLALSDKRISKEGVIIIKAQQYRTQEKNRSDAVQRLADIITSVTLVPKVRRATRPGKGARKRRLDDKAKRSKTKALRGKIVD